MKNSFIGTLEDVILENSPNYKNFDVFIRDVDGDIVWIGYVYNIYDEFQFNEVIHINEDNNEIWINY